MFIRKRDYEQRLAWVYEAGYRDGHDGTPFKHDLGHWVDPSLVPLLPDEEPESGSDYTAFMDPPVKESEAGSAG